MRSSHAGRWMLASALLAGLLLSATAVTASFAAVRPLKIKPETLKLATATVPSSQTLSATGGTAPYTFTVESGSPPEGIALSAAGELTGTPTTAGTSTFTVLATDSSSPARSVTKTYALTVQLDVGPRSLHKVKANGFVNVPLTAAGGSGSYEFTLASGALPEGVQLNSEPGFDVLLGTPFDAGAYTFAIEAKDKSTGLTGTRSYKWKIALTMSAEGGAQPEGAVGKSYFATANVVGGSGNYTYEVTEGALPEGLVLGQEQTSATFSGTPQKAETAKFTLTGTDTETGATVSAKYHLTVRSIAFPRLAKLEERDGEGAFLGSDVVFFQITHEAKGIVHGTIEDGNGATGTWTYNTATSSIKLDWPKIDGSEGFPYSGTCDQVAEECTGTQPSGTFTLRAFSFGG
jgi:large repetitive protein